MLSKCTNYAYVWQKYGQFYFIVLENTISLLQNDIWMQSTGITKRELRYYYKVILDSLIHKHPGSILTMKQEIAHSISTC